MDLSLGPDGNIRLSYTPTNLEAHQRLREKFMGLLDTMRCRNEVYENRQYADHQRPVTYEMRPPKPAVAKPNPAELFVHMPTKVHKPAASGSAAG